MVIQQSLVLIKPDGIVKSLTGNIITTLSETKLKIVAAKVVKVSKELAEKHYSNLKEQKIKELGTEKGTKLFEDIVRYIRGEFHTDRVFALVYEGEEAIERIRKLAGSTNPERAEPTSIRGKFGRINSQTQVMENVMHVSDSEESAKREIQLWFSPNELTQTIYPIKKTNKKIDIIIWDN